MTDVVNATETFYPSCVVNFNMVFERRLMVREDGATNEALRAEDNSGVFVMQRVPKKCSVELQGHVQAATFKLTFDYTELPVDPRTVAAASVEIHMGTVSKRDFSNGIQRTMNNQGWRRSQLVTRNERGEAIEDNLVMVGVVDEWSVEHGENGSEVHLSGRDLRGILLDSPLVTPRDRGQLQTGTQARSGGSGRQPSRRKRRTTILDRLNTTLDIVQLVAQILSEHDGLMRFRQPILVETDLAWWPFGRIPSPGEASRVPRHRRGAGGGSGAAGAGASGMNFWDVITRYCYLVGALPTFVGRSLVIRPAFNLFQQIQRQEFITAFRPNGQRSDGNESWGIRRLVWGRDIKDLKLSRKYTGKNKPRTVRCISYRVTRESRGHEAFIEVFYPPRNRRDARRQHNRADEIAGQESEQIDTVPVPDAVNEEQLLACARSLYEMRGRNEMAGSFEVEKPTSYAGANSDPDMLRLRVGDPVELLVDASRFAGDSPITSTLNRTRQLPFDAAVEELKKLLGDTNLCRAIVGSSRGNIMGVLAYFRVSSVSFDFSDDGIKIKADIQNYWTPKYDVEAQNRDRSQPHRQVASQRVQRVVTRAGGETAAQNGTAASSSGLQMQPMDAPQLRTVPVNTAATAGHNNYVSAWRRNHGAGPTPEAARRVENLENDTSGGSRWRE